MISAFSRSWRQLCRLAGVVRVRFQPLLRGIALSFLRGWRQVSLSAEVIQGWFRPGLAKLVTRLVADHLSANPQFCAHRYPHLIRVSRWAVHHPVLAPAIVAFLYAVILILAGSGLFESFKLANDDQASVRDFWTVSIGVLGVQAALVGLVFPLVIAFVGLLNRGRASFASRLTIYLESSSAVFVGVSSLLLCITLASQLPFAARMGDAGLAVALLNLTWFAINVSGLTYFVLRTIAFLHPARRAPIIRAYVANVIWPRELRTTITANRWANAVYYGYLPSGDASDPFATGERVRTWYSALWDGGIPRVRRRLRRKMRLVDVRFAMLKPVVQSWLVDARAADDGEVHDFVIPLELGRDYEGDQVLASATRPLGWFSRVVIWASLRFRKAPAEDGIIHETSAILREMIADLIALIDSRQADEFGDQLSEVISFHAFLYRLAQLSDEDLNYAQFGVGGNLFGNPLSTDWARVYRDINRRAVGRLAEETEFVERLAHAPAHICGQLVGEVTPNALEPTLWMAQNLAYRLIDWAVGEHRAQASSDTARKQAFSLSRHEEAYGRAWRQVVAGWERLFQAMAAEPYQHERRDRSWEDLKRIAQNVRGHLSATTHMTARAVWLGDTLGTSWTCDLMLHWSIQAERAWDSRDAYWRVRSEALTYETLEVDWVQVEELSLAHGGDQLPASLVFGAIMHNAWRDHILILACLCIHWTIHADAAETAIQAARMLLHGEPHDLGDIHGAGEGDLSGAEILISSLRIRGSGDRFDERSYAGHVEHLLENLGEIGDSPWVSMRIYSSNGGLSFGALSGAQAIAMMATSRAEQAINEDLRRLLTQSDDEALRRRQEFLEALLASFDKIDADMHGALLNALVRSADGASFSVRREHARNLVEQSLNLLIGRRAQAVADAQVDQARIMALANAASSEAFARTEFPRHLFAEITETTDILDEFSLRVTGVSKGAYIEPPMAQAVSNEEEWWRDSMSSRTAAVVWRDVLRKASFREIEGRTPDDFWAAVRDGSDRIRKMEHDPILVIGNVADPGWLLDWRWPKREGGAPKPADLVITREDEQVDGYEFTMNGTPVYRAQTAFGSAYLISKQLLRRLRYHVFDNSLSVCIRFEPDPANAWLGTLHAIFQRDVELGEGEAYRIRWRDEPDVSRTGEGLG